MHYYKRHLGDYARDTGHLTALEHGVYTLLLDWYYANERPIPLDKPTRIARGNPEETQTVLSEFFHKTPEGWIHHYADRQIAEYSAKAERNREVGKLGGRPPKNPDGFQKEPRNNPNHKPLTINHKKERAIAPRKRGKQPKVAMPADFGISDRVRTWAAEKGHHSLEARLEHFRSKAKSNGYAYADWDEAFMGAIRDDWAKLADKPAPSVPQTKTVKEALRPCETPEQAHATWLLRQKELGVSDER